MGTPFSQIYDLALIVIKDYNIEHLFATDIYSFNTLMEGMLVRSIPKFVGCAKSLDYNFTEDGVEFNRVLSTTEQVILADLMVLTWFESNMNDIRQMNLHLTGRDFKMYAESQNLKEKSETFDRLREKVRQDICDYQLNL